MVLHGIKQCGVDNVCWDCCTRSGRCCWSPCCSVVVEYNSYRCHYGADSTCTNRDSIGTEHQYYFRSEGAHELFAAPAGYDRAVVGPPPNSQTSIEPTGCFAPGGDGYAGMYWRSPEPVVDTVWHTLKSVTDAGGCPPATQESPGWYLWARHLNTAFTTGYLDGGGSAIQGYWSVFLSKGKYIESNNDGTSAVGGVGFIDPAVAYGVTESYTNTDSGTFETEYRCCGASVDTRETTGTGCLFSSGSGYYTDHRVGYIRMGTQAACCRDTTDSATNCDTLDSGGSNDPANCPFINHVAGRDTDWDEEQDPNKQMPKNYQRTPNCCASCEEDDCVDLPIFADPGPYL